MLLKRYRSPNLDTALRAVRKELGDDALLVETRRVADGYEVLAAPASEAANLRRAHRAARQSGTRAEATTQPRTPQSATGRRWTQGFRALAERALDLGWSPRVLGAVEKALLGTKVHLERPGDPAVPGLSQRVLAALIRTRSLEDPDTRVLAFVGPTGVGKTTTLAKFAARAIRDREEAVAIVTLDTYRIAAVEQLRAFADMLACPFEVAFTPNDLRRAVTRFLEEGYDRVLIDTTGRSPLDDSALHDLAEVLHSVRADTALCIPASSRARDARRIVAAWSLARRPTAVVLTKADETDAPGEVLSVLVEDALPLSHVTDGQRVPEDIDAADADRLARAALREPRTRPAPATEAAERAATPKPNTRRPVATSIDQRV
jgi:flagellar biosynthesis protein FlhF